MPAPFRYYRIRRDRSLVYHSDDGRWWKVQEDGTLTEFDRFRDTWADQFVRDGDWEPVRDVQ